MVEDVRYVWIRGPAYGGNSGRRFLNMVSFAMLALVVQARFQRPSAVIGWTVHPLAAAAAYLMARLRGARFFFEVRDLWPQTLIDMGALREGSAQARALRWIEAFLVTRGDGVITLLPGVESYLQERGLRPMSLLYLPNGVDLAPPPRIVAGVRDRVASAPRDVARWQPPGPVSTSAPMAVLTALRPSSRRRRSSSGSRTPARREPPAVAAPDPVAGSPD